MIEADEVVADEHEEEIPLPGIPFEKLREGRCKFPLGRLSDTPERFCGKPATIGSPYCPACRRIVYVPNVRRPR